MVRPRGRRSHFDPPPETPEQRARRALYRLRYTWEERAKIERLLNRPPPEPEDEGEQLDLIPPDTREGTRPRG